MMILFQVFHKAKIVNRFSAFLLLFILRCVVQIGCQKEDIIQTCQKIVIGKIPYSKKDCKQYYQCTAGRPVLKECPTKELFDRNMLKCVASKLVNCDKIQISKTTKSSATIRKSTTRKSTTKKSTTKKSTTKKSTKPPKTTIQEIPRLDNLEACVPNITNMKDGFALALEHNGSHYSLSNHKYKDDVSAEALCRRICGTLVVIDNSEEEKFVVNFFVGIGVRCLLIGGNDKKTEGLFTLLSTGKHVPYLRWAPGKPDGGKFYNCLSYSSDADGMLDMSCTFRLNDPCSFMCEIKKKV